MIAALVETRKNEGKTDDWTHCSARLVQERGFGVERFVGSSAQRKEEIVCVDGSWTRRDGCRGIVSLCGWTDVLEHSLVLTADSSRESNCLCSWYLVEDWS